MSTSRPLHVLTLAVLAAAGVVGVVGQRVAGATTVPAVRQYSETMYPMSADYFGSSAARAELDKMAADHTTSITIVIQYHQSTVTSSDIVPGADTPTDASLTSIVGYARSKGLHVSAVMHVDPDDGSWRAYIMPADRDRWFGQYDTLLRHDATLLQAAGAQTFVLGAEMTGVSTNAADPTDGDRWKLLIADVRSRFSGLLTYSAQRSGGSGEVDTVTFWPLLDEIGISAYWALGSSPTDTVANLKADWAHIDATQVQPLYVRWGKPILFTEVGYRSYTGSHLQPWNYSVGGSYDGQEQARDYWALVQYWQTRPYWAGVAFWELGPHGGSPGAGDIGYTPEGKPAEASMTYAIDHPQPVVPDRTPPTVVNDPPTANGTVISIGWSGSDPGSGIATADLYLATDGGAFQPWRTVAPTYRTGSTAGGTVTLGGVAGHSYTIVARARDRAGNVSPWSRWQRIQL